MLNFHKKEKDFLEAIRKTSQNSGFSEILIEKDYYCSLLLREIFQTKDHLLVFKGGTLLNKCYAGFYRLSEDLDFSISDKPKTSRKQRLSLAKKSKEYVTDYKNPQYNQNTPFLSPPNQVFLNLSCLLCNLKHGLTLYTGHIGYSFSLLNASHNLVGELTIEETVSNGLSKGVNL